jgi:phosphatidylinositol alpha-1,6-mannosyltransferase
MVIAVKPTLLLLSLDYPPNDGGISRLSSGLTQALLDAGCVPRVVTFPASDKGGLARPQVEYVEIPRYKGVRDFQLMRAVRHAGRDTPILTTVWNPEASLALLSGARRVAILAHGNEVMPYPRKGLKASIRQWVMERARVVICNSRFTETLVQQIAPRANTTVLNPAINADHFVPPRSKHQARTILGLPSDARILLTVARLDPIKGHETVLRSMATLPEPQRKNFYYVIIGKGEMQNQLSDLSRALGLGEQVHFAGFVTDADLPLWYGAADLFVLPSVVDPSRRGMEGFGMVLTEAQAAGLPVIGTRSGGIPDAVREGEGGWLIAERDTKALAIHLLNLLSAPEIFAEQGRRGSERVRREMTWNSYAHRLLELI